MLLSSVSYLIFTAPGRMLPAMIDGATAAITLTLTMLAIYCVWLSLLKLMENAGINKFLNKLCRPITKRLFKGESDQTLEYITVNMSANLLGMGGAATPMGIKAIESMCNDKSKKFATDNMILLLVINCTSIQLFPATIIGLRASEGSANPADIILPCLIATLCSTLIGIVLCKILARK